MHILEKKLIKRFFKSQFFFEKRYNKDFVDPSKPAVAIMNKLHDLTSNKNK